MKFDNYVFKDTIEINDKTLSVEFAPEAIAKNYYMLIDDLTKAEKDLTTKEQVMKYSNLIVRLMNMIFGIENTAYIVDAYENNMNGMIEVVTFYLATKIAPVMREASKAHEKRLKQQNRAMRRLSCKAWIHRW